MNSLCNPSHTEECPKSGHSSGLAPVVSAVQNGTDAPGGMTAQRAGIFPDLQRLLVPFRTARRGRIWGFSRGGRRMPPPFSWVVGEIVLHIPGAFAKMMVSADDWRHSVSGRQDKGRAAMPMKRNGAQKDENGMVTRGKGQVGEK